MDSNSNKQDIFQKNRKLVFIIGVVLFILVSALIIILAIDFNSRNAIVEILVAPRDATIRIGDHNYHNGKQRLLPGEYTVSVQREGFQGFETTIIAKAGEDNDTIYACLIPIDEEGTYYADHPDDARICQDVGDREYEETIEQQTDPLFDVLPYHSYNDGFDIDMTLEPDPDTNLYTIIITPISCTDAEQDILIDDAERWLKNHDIDINNYVVRHHYDCGSRYTPDEDEDTEHYEGQLNYDGM